MSHVEQAGGIFDGRRRLMKLRVSTLATAALVAVSLPTLSNTADARGLGGFGMHGGFGHVGGWGGGGVHGGWGHGGWGWGGGRSWACDRRSDRCRTRSTIRRLRVL